MALFEALSLDGLSITGDPTQTLSIEAFDAPPPTARAQWIGAADSEWSALARSPLYENREITIRVRVKTQTTMDLALDQIGLIRDKLRKASLSNTGITLTWTPADSARTVTFDVLHGEVQGLPVTPSGDDAGWFQRRPVISVKLTAKPYWRGTETLTSTASSGSTPLVTLEVAGVTGDAPALGRLIVTDTATQSRRHVEFGVENQFYVSPGTATPLLIDSDNLVVSGFMGAQATGVTGAYDPGAPTGVVVQASPTTSVTAMCGTGTLSHVGTFRVWARIAASHPDTHFIRLAWRAGDSQYRANDWAQMTSLDAPWSEVDLGLISIPSAISGTQRWDGRIEVVDTAKTGTAPAALNLDYLILMPVAEGYGVARAPYRYTPGVTVGRDDFTGTTVGGALNARTAPAGGSWATSGATTDFLFSENPPQEYIQRSTLSDTGVGRFGILGTTNFTDVEVFSRILTTYTSLDTVSTGFGLIARYVDSSNYLLLELLPPLTLRLAVVIAGVQTTIKQYQNLANSAGIWYQLRLIAYTTGHVIADFMDDSGNSIVTLDASNANLATGGTLATGKPGIRDRSNGVIPVTRLYDDFYVATPAAEPIALFSGRSLEVRHNATIRQDSGGTFYGRPPAYRGSRFLLQPGTSRVAVKARRNDVVTADAGNVTDGTQIQVGWTPRGVVVPR